jgi:hypothetical protein
MQGNAYGRSAKWHVIEQREILEIAEEENIWECGLKVHSNYHVIRLMPQSQLNAWSNHMRFHVYRCCNDEATVYHDDSTTLGICQHGLASVPAEGCGARRNGGAQGNKNCTSVCPDELMS